MLKRVDAEAARKLRKVLRTAIVLYAIQRLSEVGLATPDGQVQRPLGRAGIDKPHKFARAFGVVSFANVVAAAERIPRFDSLPQLTRFGPTGRVLLQIRQDSCIGVDNVDNQLGPRYRFLQLAWCSGSAGNQRLDFKLVGIDHEADHRLLIIRITTDVGQDGKSWAVVGPKGGRRENTQAHDKRGEA